MAVLSVTDRLTMLEAVKRDGFNADSRMIIETLAATNQMLYDAPAFESNAGVVNRTVQRAALPQITHRKVNEGTANSASETKELFDYVCQLTGYSQIDKTLVDAETDKAGFIRGELDAFVAAMGNSQATDIIYGDHDADSAFINGLAKRRAKVDNETVIDFGGTGSNLTSLYLVKWGRDAVHMIYPKGSTSCGVSRQDDGIVDALDQNNNKYKAYQNYFQCDYGIVVRNPKALIRIANIDLNASGFDAVELVKAIIKSSHKLCEGTGTVSILSNRDVMSEIDIATMEKGNLALPFTDAWGNDVNTIRGMRMRQCDAILNTESKAV